MHSTRAEATARSPRDRVMAPLPHHVAIIMDGHERRRSSSALPDSDAVAASTRATRRVIEAAVAAGIPYLTLDPFSAGRARGPREPLPISQGFIERFATCGQNWLLDRGVRVRAVGAVDDLPTSARHAIEEVTERTAQGGRITVSLAVCYGGRRDIVEAVRALAIRVRAGLALPEDIDEQSFRSELATHGLPQVDLLIRTGSERRLTDFLLYEAADAHLCFVPVPWPKFRAEHFRRALAKHVRRRHCWSTSPELVDHRTSREHSTATAAV